MKKHELETGNGYSRVSTPPSAAQLSNQSAQRGVRLRQAKAFFLVAAGLSFLASVSLWFLVDREQGLFVGLWVPSILSLGGLMLQGQGGAR